MKMEDKQLVPSKTSEAPPMGKNKAKNNQSSPGCHLPGKDE